MHTICLLAGYLSAGVFYIVHALAILIGHRQSKEPVTRPQLLLLIGLGGAGISCGILAFGYLFTP